MNSTMQQRPPALVRPRDDRVIAGVGSGLAHRFGIGTGWVRVGFVFLSFFGGLGVLLYIVGWLAIREEGQPTAIAERWIGDLEGSTAWIGVGLIILAGMILLGATNVVRVELVLAGGLFLAGVLLYRGRLGPDLPASPEGTEPDGVATAPHTTDTDDEPAVPSEGAEPLAASPPPVVADGRSLQRPVEPLPPREPSYLGRIVVASALIVVGGMALLDNLDVIDPGARHYVAAGVLVLGLGLLVGSLVGRARGLIAIGLLLLPVLLVTAAVRVPFAGEWGDRRFTPADAGELRSSYELSGGQMTLDLRGLTGVESVTPVTAELGIGEMIVRLPAAMDVEVSAGVGIGALDIFGSEEGGVGVDDRFVVGNGDGEIDLVLDLEVGIGAIQITGTR